MVAADSARPVATDRNPAFTPIGSALAIAVIGIAAFVAGTVWVEVLAPVQIGSVSAVLGEADPCSGSDSGDTPIDCYIVPFAEGREVGIGFTVRNDAPIGMTILDVEVIRDGVSTPAVLEPQLTEELTTFGLTEGVPFEPTEVPAGAERGIQFVGTYGDCETVAEHWVPGSGLSVSQAFLKVQWGVFMTDVELPLTTALALAAPTTCP